MVLDVAAPRAKDALRAQIVDAARKRFKHYGYGKTTMAELAADCNCSPGNLYRYFPSKLDIADALATEASLEVLDRLKAVAQAPGRTATQRVVDFFFEDLRSTYRMLDEERNIVELALTITRERPEWANQDLARQRALLASLLEEGHGKGEFHCPDPAFVAELMQAATMKFRYPQLWSRLELHELERELAGVLRLLAYGFSEERLMDDGLCPSRQNP